MASHGHTSLCDSLLPLPSLLKPELFKGRNNSNSVQHRDDTARQLKACILVRDGHVGGPPSLFPSCVTSGMLLNFSVPLFLHL